MIEVRKFEETIANFFNSPYAIATDCCTHALELCLRYIKPCTVTCPTNTYLSVPMTLKKLNIPFTWDNSNWQNYYYLKDTNIVDAAVYWEKGGYVPCTMMCLSFQFKKHLKLGRGGMILLDNHTDYQVLKKMRYDGRSDDKPWAEQEIETLGYHYYMTPETAKLGCERFDEVKDLKPKLWSNKDYPDISKLKVFNDVE